jgi:DNA sulfur modification protein DndD
MKMNRIKLWNWCQYEGEHLLDLGFDTAKNVILIHADNDVGKSSLFNSIQWCFHEELSAKWKAKDWPLYPLPWYERAKDNERIETKVELTYVHKGRVFCRTRSFETQKTKNGPIAFPTPAILQEQQPNGVWVTIGEEKLHRIFPKSVLGYFLFDAETIEHFVNQSDNVRNSVRRLLDIEDAERAYDRLGTVATDLRRQSKKNENDDTTKLEEEIVTLEDSIAKLKAQLDATDSGLRPELEQVRKKRKLIEEQLFKYKDAHELLNEEKGLKEEARAAGEKEITLLKKLRSTTQSLHITLLQSSGRSVLKQLDEKRQKGELPKHVKQGFVDERIKLGACICETPLTPGSASLAAIEKFRNTLSDALSDVAQKLNNRLIAFDAAANTNNSQLLGTLQDLEEQRTRKLELGQKLKDVSSKIQARTDIPDVPQLQAQKDHLENREQELLKTIGSIETQISDRETVKADKNEELKVQRKKLKFKDESVKRWILATTAQAALGKAIESFKGRARAFLEQECNTIAKALFWREDVYQIHINKDYFISVTSPNYGDVDLLTGMSMGITQMTGLALITALAKQTQCQAPLIMDTPFARLGHAHRTRALEQCPEYFEQWILFLQPGEWEDKEYRRFVQPKILKEYTLKRDNSTGITNLVTGYRSELFGKIK